MDTKVFSFQTFIDLKLTLHLFDLLWISCTTSRTANPQQIEQVKFDRIFTHASSNKRRNELLWGTGKVDLTFLWLLAWFYGQSAMRGAVIKKDQVCTTNPLRHASSLRLESI
jgi:hypothetical protein